MSNEMNRRSFLGAMGTTAAWQAAPRIAAAATGRKTHDWHPDRFDFLSG
jgi:hypothetical protein